jgi:hypothetical protein
VKEEKEDTDQVRKREGGGGGCREVLREVRRMERGSL